MKKKVSTIDYMSKAIETARLSLKHEDIPVGAVIVKDGKIIASAYNTREKCESALGHAEINAINIACKKLHSWRLDGCAMYVTLEPCIMCAGAIISSHIERLYYCASDAKAGAINMLDIFNNANLNHHVLVELDIMHQEESSALIKTFFESLRQSKKSSK